MHQLFILILMVVTDGGLSSTISKQPLLVVLYLDHNQATIYLETQSPSLTL